MKCPKCGFNSFEYLDACKKCAAPLQEFKQGHGIKPLLFPPPENGMSPADPAESFDGTAADDDFMFETAAVAAPAVAPAPEESGFDGFSFDFNANNSNEVEDDAFDFNMTEDDSAGLPVEGNDMAAPPALPEEEGEFSLDAFTSTTNDEFSFDDVLPQVEEEKEKKKEQAPAEELDDWSALFAEDKEEK